MPPTVGSNSIDGSAGSQPQTAEEATSPTKIHITIWRSDDARRSRSEELAEQLAAAVDGREAEGERLVEEELRVEVRIGSSETATTIA